MLAALPIEQGRDMGQRVLTRVALRLAVTGCSADQPFNRWNSQGMCVARLLRGEVPGGAVTLRTGAANGSQAQVCYVAVTCPRALVFSCRGQS
jgi:hypothetical protein